MDTLTSYRDAYLQYNADILVTGDEETDPDDPAPQEAQNERVFPQILKMPSASVFRKRSFEMTPFDKGGIREVADEDKFELCQESEDGFGINFEDLPQTKRRKRLLVSRGKIFGYPSKHLVRDASAQDGCDGGIGL